MAENRKNMPAKGKQKRFLGIQIIGGLFCLLAICFFFGAGRFLTLNQTVQDVDAIIVLSGEEGRVERAVELYREGYAPYLILSNAGESAGKLGNMIQAALALGVSREDVLTEYSARSTYQNAENTLSIMKSRKFTSAIVVSSDYHMRRVKLNFSQYYKRSGIKLIYVGASSNYKASRWWGDKYSVETTFNEYVKLVGNMLGYNGPEAKQLLRKIKIWF